MLIPLQGSQETTKIFKLWVGDKDSKNLPGAEVFIDGVSKGVTDSNGEVRTEVSFGQHTFSAKIDCGQASKDYDFSDSIDGATLIIDSCPAIQTKIFKLWVGDKDSKNLPGAEVFIDDVSKGVTDSNGEVRTEVSFGQHTFSAKIDCGQASKDYDFSDSIDGATLIIDSCPAIQTKIFKLWVGDKDSKNLPGAEVFIDGVSKGVTDSNGEVRTEVSFGQHTFSAKIDCGQASKDYDFSDSIDGATLIIDSCPAIQTKIFKLWVGDKDSKNLPGAEVFIDGVSKGVTDSNGEVRTEVSFGQHTFSAKIDCGQASKDYDFSDSIDGATLIIDSCPAIQTKIFKLWVGDKDSKNLPGAEVFIDGVSKGVTDSNGEVRTEVSFGQHTFSAKIDCGQASKDYDFSDSIDGATLIIDSCPNDENPSGSASEIRFEGTAIEFIKGTIPGAPSYWIVSVDELISGSQPCSTKIDVITAQSISPAIWGASDGNIKNGDKTEVYGSYVKDDKGCHVTLHGSNSYYIKKGLSGEAAKLTVQGEVLTDLMGSVGSSDNKLNIRLNKIIYNPQNIILVPGSISTVHADQYATLHDCVKGRCYEFSGDWLNWALWVKGEVKRVECPGETKKQGCGQIIRYDISKGKYSPGQIILADMEYKSNLNRRADFKGVLLLRSPDEQIYSNWKKESTPAYGQESFGYYNKGNAIDVKIPEGAAAGSYDAKLELRQYDSGELCAETNWLEDQFEVMEPGDGRSSCAEILKYNISNGEYPRGQIILADMKYKSNLKLESDFTGVLRVRSPANQIYSNSEKQRTAAGREDNFGYGKGNSIGIKIPEDASIGSYAAKLEIHRSDTRENYAMPRNGWRISSQFQARKRFSRR